jgi:5-methyltetrahydrofolate--homocysteine methyltransferase
MKDILRRIADGEVLLSDGAMGTMLIDYGIELDQCFEAINLTRPDVLENIARSYFKAGSDIVQANTFGGSPMKLALYSLADKYEAINRAAVEAARRAVENKAIVSASIGPCGRLMKPYGDAEPDDVFDSFKKQIEVVVDSGADMILVETMTDIEEAKLAVKATRAVSETIPVGATMTFDPTPRGFFTIMGTNIETAVKELESAGVDMLGSNCGNGIEIMIDIAREFKKYATKPTIIQPNAGLPEMVDGRAIYNESPEFMAEKAKSFLEIGISIIGGCCGTTPTHIAAMRAKIDSFNK